MVFLDAEQRETAIRCFGLGMSQSDVARRLRIPVSRIRNWMHRGARGRSGWQRDFWLDVTEAQGAFHERALAALMAQAEGRGGLPAVQALLERLEHATMEATAEAVPEDELGAKRFRLMDVRRRILASGDTAYTKLVREERELLTSIKLLEAAADARAKEASSLRAMTSTDAVARLRARVGQLLDGDLRDLLKACSAELAERGLA